MRQINDTTENMHEKEHLNSNKPKHIILPYEDFD
jgi:hypothetical protein